jgi:hypothetical protein
LYDLDMFSTDDSKARFYFGETDFEYFIHFTWLPEVIKELTLVVA